jgi:hypothetical protein
MFLLDFSKLVLWFNIKNKDIETREIELVAIAQPITGGKEPAIPPITIF